MRRTLLKVRKRTIHHYNAPNETEWEAWCDEYLDVEHGFGPDRASAIAEYAGNFNDTIEKYEIGFRDVAAGQFSIKEVNYAGTSLAIMKAEFERMQ